MKNFLLHKPSKKHQYPISILLVLVVAVAGLALYDFAGYRVAAFMLLVTVSVLAMFFDIAPVLLAALLSALIWDFLFIPPRYTLTVGTGEDQLLLLMYFVIALVNATLTYKIRQMEKEVRVKEEKANEARFYNTLFNSLSHELRTPITTIIAATDNLNSRSGLSDALKAELLSEISIASLRLNQQVENLLSMSRLESGIFQIKKDWCDVNELVHKTLRRFEPSISKYELAVHIPENLPLFKLDFGLMEQVLHNLIGNAMQHTPEGTGIVVQAFHDHDKLVITVADNGKGFPEGEMEKAFDKFYRLHGSKPGGTGLGLSIARGFVEAHHGTITLKNLPLSGAIFTIEIPTETSSITRLKNE
jgi:two-component system, OmpR family, sensor histidine kinase KdpD